MDCLKEIRSGREISRASLIGMTLKLSFPAILAQLSSILMQYIDAAMVGRLGEMPSASVGLMASSGWFFTGIASMATMGFSVQIAHNIGAGNTRGARSVVRQGLTSMILFGFLLGLTGMALAPFIPHWLGGDKQICPGASSYFLILMSGLPLLTVNYMAGGMLRCAGNMKTPSALNVLMCLLDVVFNYFLIFPTREIDLAGMSFTMPGAGMGISGAALGTVLAEGVTMVLMLRFLLAKQPSLKLKGHEKGSFRPQKEVVRKALRIASPMMLEHMVFCSAQITTTAIVAPLGAVAIAANAFAVTAESLCYMPGFGIGDAATAVVGQSYGAGRRDLVKRFCHVSVGLGVAVMTLMGLMLWIFAPVMMEILSPVESICSLGTEVLRIEAWVEPMYAASIVAYGAFVGAADTLIPAIMNFGSIWGVRVPLAFLMAPVFGLRGVWIAMAVELTFRGIIFLWRMWSGKWYSRMGKESVKPELPLEVPVSDTE